MPICGHFFLVNLRQYQTYNKKIYIFLHVYFSVRKFIIILQNKESVLAKLTKIHLQLVPTVFGG
jgi:hypothetical protein